MDVRIRYFDDCPSWRTAEERVRAVLADLGRSDVRPLLERVATPEDADRLRFVGSPTILVNGRDPFAGPGREYGLSCRVYETPEGFAGAPTTEQIREALRGVA
jgi:hypothetical protein